MPGWKLGLLVGLGLVIATPILAAQIFPWWGTLLVLLGEIGLIVTLGPQCIRWGVTQIAMGVLQRKSRVLQGAGIEVHEIKAVARPGSAANEPPAAGDDAPRYVQVDVTITPRPSAGTMHFYEPGELLLVPYEAPVSASEHPEEGTAAAAEEVLVVEESGSVQPDPGRIAGPARLRILFACPPALTGRAKLRYYFEPLGDLALP